MLEEWKQRRAARKSDRSRARAKAREERERAEAARREPLMLAPRETGLEVSCPRSLCPGTAWLPELPDWQTFTCPGCGKPLAALMGVRCKNQHGRRFGDSADNSWRMEG